jgi:hypothetical protein
MTVAPAPPYPTTRPARAFALAAALLAAPGLATAAAQGFSAQEDDDAITLRHGDQTVLVYHKAVVPPPEGADPAFARSGFIHPLHSPSGATVTGIHPDDHIHHIGLWHAWVHTIWNGREVDFWNLAKKLGTVRYAKTLEVRSQPDAPSAGFAVEQEHVAFPEGGGEPSGTVVLRERLDVTVSGGPDGYAIGYTMLQTNVTDSPLEMPAYRYGGGIAYRSPGWWEKENSDYLSSEGKTRVDGHTTRARWCAMWGPAGPDDEATATVAILCHPENHDAPQRMRVWPEGKIFFNYVPVQESGWALAPGESTTLRYRLLVSDQKPDREMIDAAWAGYARGD